MRPSALLPSLLLPWALALSASGQDTPGGAQKTFSALERTVDLDWKRRPFGEALAELSAAEGLTITLDPSATALASKPVSLHVANQPLGSALDRLANRLGLDLRISGTGEILLIPAPGAVGVPDWVDDAQPVRHFLLGRYHRLPPPNGWADPIAPLGADDAAAFVKPTAKTWSALLDKYVDRIEAWHLEKSNPSPDLIAFFKANPGVRKEFWRALDPRFDDATAACRIMDEFRAKDPKRLIEFKHLAIAIAVVFDTPVAAVDSRYNLLWMVTEQQFGPVLSYSDIYDWFSGPKNQSLFRFKPATLVWPVMINQIDLDVSSEEMAWALKQYINGTKVDLAALYAQVPYDNAKLAHTGTKLGSQPYTLQNLRQYGGVCVDQAHFSSRVAKLFGVPSLKCGGNGRYGGAGHAWTGYLGASKAGKPELLFTGRYQGDLYYTGTAFNPQTRTELLDRDVELLYAGASADYASYADAGLLARGARALEATDPAQAAIVAREAVKRNPYNADGWRVLLRTSSADEAEKSWQQLSKTLPGYPDMVWEGLRISLSRMPDDVNDKAIRERRQKLYTACYLQCGTAKRPDLQIQVRLAQVDELATAKQDEEVISLSFETVRANVKEGTIIMPLVKRVVTLANRFAVENPRFRKALVKDTFTKIEKDFPKARGTDINPAWTEWQELMRTLK